MTSLWSLVQACVWLQFVSKYDHLYTTLLGFVSIMKFCFSHLYNNRQWQIMLFMCLDRILNQHCIPHSDMPHYDESSWYFMCTRYTHVHHVPHQWMWKDQSDGNGKARRAVETTPCRPLPILSTGQWGVHTIFHYYRLLFYIYRREIVEVPLNFFPYYMGEIIGEQPVIV